MISNIYKWLTSKSLKIFRDSIHKSYLKLKLNLKFINFIFINNMSTKMALFIPIRYLHTQNKEENSKYVNRPKWMDFSVKVYDNIDNKINRDSILDENKGKSGIYL